MFPNFTVDWKESLLILLGLVIIILVYYLFNRKSIAQEKEAKLLFRKHIEVSRNEMHKAIPPVPPRKSSPQVLQAYERLTILMERTDLHRLVNRVLPISPVKQDYAHFLIQTVEQEYEFNVSQQIYVTDEAWALITTAKNTIIQDILKTALKEDVLSADDLRAGLLKINSKDSITELAKTRLRKEVADLV